VINGGRSTSVRNGSASKKVLQPSRSVKHPLDHNATVIRSEKDEVAAVNRLSQTLGEVIAAPKCARSFRDASANSD
jgi:hypothetical protein